MTPEDEKRVREICEEVSEDLALELKQTCKVLIEDWLQETLLSMFKLRRQNAERQARFRARHNVTTEGPGNVIKPVNGNAVEYIPSCREGEEFGVSKELLAELEAAYPGVDGPATLKEIRAWSLANKAKRKTLVGMPRFINWWFAKEQNRGA